MKIGPIACVLVLFACSGSAPATAPASTTSAPPPPPHPTTTTPVPGGLGRVPDVPIAACTHERASVPRSPDAHPTGCHRDADCTEGQNGRCRAIENRGRGPVLHATRCTYDACFSDADCDAREICICDPRAADDPGEGHFCLPSECMTDAECAGGYCRRTNSGNVCHTLDDRCVEETDCGPGQRCQRPGGTGPWSCMPFTMPAG